jgi:thioredoxin-related protein
LDTVTYKDEKAVSFINDNFVAMRINTSSVPGWAQSYTIQYTPTIIIVDDSAHEKHRVVGFLPPHQFIPMLTLGIAKVDYEQGNVKRSKQRLEAVIKEYPGTDFSKQAQDIRSRMSA